MPLAPPTLGGFAFLGVLSWLTFTPLLWWDFKTLHRLHWATILGAGLFAATLSLRLLLVGSSAWAAFASHLPGL
jgi:hypothetical protein